MSIEIACAAAGFAAGIFVQRFFIFVAVKKFPRSICDYCKWKKGNEWRWGKQKNRHIK